jgi:outer membrane protein
MNKISNIVVIICLILLAYLLIDKFTNSNVTKIGVVQMDKLVYEFKGMKEATNRYSEKMKSWNGKSDSLERKLKELYNQIRLDSLGKDQLKLDRDIKIFMIFKQSYMEYVQNVQANAEKEDKEMTLGVVNQVNEYIKDFAKKEGFDLILTNNQQQSVGYAKDALEVTSKVLEYANNQYDGKNRNAAIL